MQALGVGGGQGSFACCSPGGRKESDMTEQLHLVSIRIKNKKHKRKTLKNLHINVYSNFLYNSFTIAPKRESNQNVPEKVNG